MGSLTTPTKNTILDFFFGGQDLTPDGTLYVRLTTTVPTSATAGTELGTGTWTNYAPLAVTNNLTNFPAASGGSKTNGTDIGWTGMTVTGAASIAGVEWWSASSGGTRRAWAAKSISIDADNSTLTIEAGDLTITLTDPD